MYYYSLALMNHNAEHCCNVEARPPPRPAPSYGGRDETCPISTEGRTRRVRLVRGGGRGAGARSFLLVCGGLSEALPFSAQLLEPLFSWLRALPLFICVRVHLAVCFHLTVSLGAIFFI